MRGGAAPGLPAGSSREGTGCSTRMRGAANTSAPGSSAPNGKGLVQLACCYPRRLNVGRGEATWKWCLRMRLSIPDALDVTGEEHAVLMGRTDFELDLTRGRTKLRPQFDYPLE